MTAVPGLASVLAPGRDVAAITAVVRDAAARTGVDFNFLLAQAKAESGLDPTARARTSSARGLYQFTSGTWLEMVRRHGNEHGLGWAAEMINKGAARAGSAALRCRRTSATTCFSRAPEGTEGTEGAEGTEQLTRRRSSGLKDLLLKQFTARSDFRDLNLGVPQSM